ncbi:MAG: hypothetical protein ACT4P1_11285 [Sporichthyaceae bacterium]
MNEALAASRPEDVIEGVKQAVRKELTGLDPSAEIEDTRYFNHSFVPDFMVKWTVNGKKATRGVYLRPSLESTLAAHDLEALSKDSPVFLSLKPSVGPELDAEVRRDVVEHAPNTMVTGVATLGEFASDPGHQAPLESLIRPNLVRGGRGLIASDTLKSLRVPLQGSADDAPLLEAFGELVREVFLPESATRLERAAQILEIGLTGDVSSLILPSIIDEPAEQLIGGQLSSAEIDVLLPYLLSRQDVTQDPAYWSYLGGMFDLARLEDLGGVLAGLDLTPLLAANVDRWTAVRAQMVINPEDGDSPAAGEWRFVGNTVAVYRGQWRVQVASKGNRLPGREDSAPARWDALVPVLQGRPVTQVALNGLQRKVNVLTDQAGGVVDDVVAIRGTIEDEFQVPSVTIRTSAGDDGIGVELNFTKMLAIADRSVIISELVDLAVDVLGHRAPEAEAATPETSEDDGG